MLSSSEKHPFPRHFANSQLNITEQVSDFGTAHALLSRCWPVRQDRANSMMERPLCRDNMREEVLPTGE
jgi:hypothetical protein